MPETEETTILRFGHVALGATVSAVRQPAGVGPVARFNIGQWLTRIVLIQRLRQCSAARLPSRSSAIAGTKIRCEWKGFAPLSA
jgi:hypothetical protein